MYTYKVTHHPKNTVEIVVLIPKEDIKKEEEKAFDKLHQNLEIAGFRKGKVPKEIAKKHIDKHSVYEQLINSLLTSIYQEIIKKEHFSPIILPKIELIKAKEGEDWEIKITIAEKPKVFLPSYKELIREIKNQQKKADIWLPGKDNPKDVNKNKEEENQEILNKILTELLKQTKFELSDLVIQEELDRRLTQLLDDIKKIGLTVEGYLKSKKTTMAELRKKMTEEIEETYKLEFILVEIAEKENIQVEKEDLDKLFSSITDEKEKMEAQKNAYFYASILRKQKTLDFLINL